MRILSYILVAGVAFSFYMHAPSFYGPLSGQLTLLRADSVHLRKSGLQRLALSMTDKRLEEFRDDKGYSRMVEHLSIEDDEGVRREVYLVLGTLAASVPATRRGFVDAGMLDVLRGLTLSEQGAAKEECESILAALATA